MGEVCRGQCKGQGGALCGSEVDVAAPLHVGAWGCEVDDAKEGSVLVRS